MKRKLLIILLLGVISISLTGCLPGLFPEPNNPPVIASSPLETATVGEEYIYNVLATDPDGDDLTYSLTTNPSTDMTIEQNSGVISWTPAAIGSYEVTAEVSDGKLSDIQNFFITVSEPLNQTPVITSTPVTSVILGENYGYTVEATDPDGDDLTYFLSTFPDGMTINPTTGVINWTPATTGDFEVTVEVSDGVLTNTQSFTITASEPLNQAPVITSVPGTSVILGETYTYTVEASDPNGDNLTYSLTTDPSTDMSIDQDTGIISWIPTTVGSFDVTVEVSDGDLSDSQSFTITVDKALLTSIEVLPSSMTLEIGESRTIDSVTAHYNNDTETIITPLSACTYKSNKSNATVSPDGLITGVSSCTASTPVTITVTYMEDGITKTDTVSVVVTNPSPG